MSRAAPLIGYLRESVWRSGSVHARLAQQRTELEHLAAENTIAVLDVEEDHAAGRSLRRPGLQRALDACREGRAAGIVVTRLDRLTRELDDLAALVAEAQERRFALVALDVRLDTRSADAVTLVRVLGQASGWSRRSLVREALPDARPAKRDRGRPFSISPSVSKRIQSMRTDGMTLQAICDVLNDEGVPTARGGSHWRPTSLRAVLRQPTTTRE